MPCGPPGTIPCGRTGSGPDAPVPNMTAMKNPAPTQTVATEQVEVTSDEQLIEEDLLVEEISIDGMCGVY